MGKRQSREKCQSIFFCFGGELLTILKTLIFRVSCRTILALFLLLVCYSFHYAQIPQRRPFVPDDIFRLAEMADVSLSPDGQWVAYVLKRPKADGGFFGRYY